MKKSKKYRIKHKGMMGTIEAIVVMFTLGLVAVAFSSPNVSTMNVGKAEGVVRKYIIKSQQQGYLSSVDKAELNKKLQDMGAKNISIRTNDNKSKYGEDVDLIVEYEVQVKELKVNDNAFPNFETTIKKVKLDKSTISTTT